MVPVSMIWEDQIFVHNGKLYYKLHDVYDDNKVLLYCLCRSIIYKKQTGIYFLSLEGAEKLNPNFEVKPFTL